MLRRLTLDAVPPRLTAPLPAREPPPRAAEPWRAAESPLTGLRLPGALWTRLLALEGDCGGFMVAARGFAMAGQPDN